MGHASTCQGAYQYNAETQGLFGGPSDPLDIFIDIVLCAYYYVVLRSPQCFFKGHYRK